jgi:hypothetical protein
MPRFYFHFDSGESRIPDREGLQLPDVEAAWYQAFRRASDYASWDNLRRAPAPKIHVEDERGLQLFALPVAEVLPLIS